VLEPGQTATRGTYVARIVRKLPDRGGATLNGAFRVSGQSVSRDVIGKRLQPKIWSLPIISLMLVGITIPALAAADSAWGVRESATASARAVLKLCTHVPPR
jgi:hypothetical protein